MVVLNICVLIFQFYKKNQINIYRKNYIHGYVQSGCKQKSQYVHAQSEKHKIEEHISIHIRHLYGGHYGHM